MFVCQPCHAADPTCPAGTKSIEEMGRTFMASRGRCEVCGETRDCVDCHGYGTIEDPAKKAKIDALNDPVHLVPTPRSPGRHLRGHCSRCGNPLGDAMDSDDHTCRGEGTEMATITETRHEHEFSEETLTCECGVTLADHVRGIA